MDEVTARPKFACPSCGAEAHWDASRQSLVCPYCGTVAPGRMESGEVRENDLVAALRNIPDDQRGWQAEKVSVKCQNCQAITVFDANRVGQRCDFCGSSALIPLEQLKAPIRPESLLAFKLGESQARDRIREWYGRHWFAPSRLKSGATTDTAKGFYLPYWTFDAEAAAEWTAESGYHYYETEIYRDSNGNEQTRQVQRTRWEPSAGSLRHFFDDELVAASQGAPPKLLRQIEPFPTHELVAYDAGYLSGWIVEQYQIDLVAAAQRSRDAMEKELYALCASQVPGDTHRALQVAADYTEQTFKHILLPVWFLTYHYAGKPYRVALNGYTGKIGGEYPLSWLKIALLVFVVLLVLILWAMANVHHG